MLSLFNGTKDHYLTILFKAILSILLIEKIKKTNYLIGHLERIFIMQSFICVYPNRLIFLSNSSKEHKNILSK